MSDDRHSRGRRDADRQPRGHHAARAARAARVRRRDRRGFAAHQGAAHRARGTRAGALAARVRRAPPRASRSSSGSTAARRSRSAPTRARRRSAIPAPSSCRRRSTAGHRVTPIPGASALTAALAASGFTGNAFCFLGFLPRTPGKLVRILEDALARGAHHRVLRIADAHREDAAPRDAGPRRASGRRRARVDQGPRDACIAEPRLRSSRSSRRIRRAASARCSSVRSP